MQIAQALFAAECGAFALLLINDEFPFSVVHCQLAHLGTMMHNYDAHLPIYLPCELSLSAIAAAVTSLVEGGPKAFSWRYRGVADGRS